MSWTDERVERLKTLWADGMSASQIAAELGEVTRNAVIGKVHRLGLSGRVKAAVGGARARPKAAQPRAAAHTARVQTVRAVGNAALKMEEAVEEEVAPQAEIIEDVDFGSGERATILTLTEHTCKWPIGDPGKADFFFCGRPSDSGMPYCPHHARVAYQPVRDRRGERKRA